MRTLNLNAHAAMNPLPKPAAYKQISRPLMMITTPTGLLSPNSCWEPSEELDTLLKALLKPLQRFERRTIIQEFPRPASEEAFTPNLDNYLTSMISGAKTQDNSLRDTLDKILMSWVRFAHCMKTLRSCRSPERGKKSFLIKPQLKRCLAVLRRPLCW